MSQENSFSATASMEDLAAVYDRAEQDREVKTYEELAERLIQGIERGDAPWMRSWEPGEVELPYNLKTGNFYHGANLLLMMSDRREDPRWMTLNQAEQMGLKLKAGELHKSVIGHHVAFKEFKEKRDAAGNRVVDEKGKVVREPVILDTPKVVPFSLYNGEQFDGLEPFVVRGPSPEKLRGAYDRIDAMVKAMGVKVAHKRMQGKETPHYVATADKAVMPRKADYFDERAYYSDLLHVVAHATSAKGRLDRDLGGFRDGHHDPRKMTQAHAFEELSVQVAAMMMVRTFNIGHFEHQTNGAYVKAWVKLLRDEPRQVLKLCQKAEDILKNCLSHEHDRSQSVEKVDHQVLNSERKYEAGKVIPLSERRQVSVKGVKVMSGPYPTAVEVAAQDVQAKEVLSRDERLNNLAIKALRAHEKARALQTWRLTEAIDPSIDGLPPAARRTKDAVLFPMAGPDGRMAGLMKASGPWQKARVVDGLLNEDVFCVFAGMKSLVGGGSVPPPKTVKPAVIVDNAATGERLWLAGANVVMAVGPTAMGKAAEALRAVRPDIPLVFALERGERVRDPKMPKMEDGRAFENAAVLRPARNGATFDVGQPQAQVSVLTAMLQTVYGSLQKGEATQKLEELEQTQKLERERELVREQIQERSRGRGR